MKASETHQLLISEHEVKQMVQIVSRNQQGLRINMKQLNKRIFGISSKMELSQKIDDHKQYLKICFCSPDVLPNQPECHPKVMLIILIYLLFKLRFTKVVMTTWLGTRENSKSKDNGYKVYLPKNQQISLNPFFLTEMSSMLREEEHLQNNLNLIIHEIYWNCEKQNIQGVAEEKYPQIINLREGICRFINLFYKTVKAIVANQQIYVLKNCLSGYNADKDAWEDKSQSYKISKQQLQASYFGFLTQQFTNEIIFKTDCLSQSLRRLSDAYSESNIRKSQICSLGEIDRKSVEYFEGTNVEYISRLVISCPQINNLNQLATVLKKMANLKIFQLIKEQELLFIEQINCLMASFISFNKHLEIATFKNIQVIEISPQLLKNLYISCPYLTEFQLKYRYKYCISETFLNLSGFERDIKLREREIMSILKCISLRKIYLKHNLNMIKILLQKGYDMNTAIEIAECIKPVVI